MSGAIPDPAGHLRREIAVSMAINLLLSGVFFLALFDRHRPASLAALRVDTLPQTFMVALMAGLVPGLMLARRQGRRRWPVALHAAGTALGITLLAGAVAWAVTAGRSGSVPVATALPLKLLYGALLGGAVTGWTVRRGLRAAPSA